MASECHLSYSNHMKIKPFYLITILVLVVIGFGIYSVNLKNKLFWDDTDWIVNNPYVHSFSWENTKAWFTENTLAGIGMRSNYYRPVLFATFTLNFVTHGVEPFGYHLANNGLHIANSILIFLLLAIGTRKRLVGAIVALLFLVHPLQTEAITYVAGRGDPLNVFFMLCALLAFVFADRGRIRPAVGYVISVPLVVLAMLSRETAIIFPFLVLAYYLAFLRSENFIPALKRGIAKTWPYFAVVFVYGILRLTVLNFDNTLNFYDNPNPYSESFLVRMFTFMGILASYAKLLIAPLGLHMERSAVVFGDPWHALVIIPFLALIGLGLWLYRLYRRSEGKPGMNEFSLWFFAITWFFINLGPTSGITPINALVYEHWLYLAMVGPALLVAWYGVWVWERWRVPVVRYGLPVALAVIVAWFSFLTVKRNIVWGDPIGFFQEIIEKYEPESARINNNLGNMFYDKGDIEKAVEHYQKAIKSNDSFPQPYYNLGSILYARGDVRGAQASFEKAVEIDPYFLYGYQGLAVIAAEQGDFVKTTELLKTVIELSPNSPLGYINLAKVLLIQNNREGARQLLIRAEALAGNNQLLQEDIIRLRQLAEKQ